MTELSIRNFAIIDHLSVSFHKGLTVLTGETGAGKSIIIDAVSLLIGQRGASHYIKHGASRAEILGQFQLTTNKRAILDRCQAYDIEVEDDSIILERILNKNGKSVCRINHKLVTLTVLREIGQMIVQIHSQHDTRHLIDEGHHINLLDHYNQAKIDPIKQDYRERYERYLALQKKYDQLQTNEQTLAHRFDLLQFQLNELNQAQLIEGEDLALEKERKQLQNFETIYYALQEAYYALHGENKALEAVHQAKSALEKAQHKDGFIGEKAESITNLYYQLEDLSIEINDYQNSLHFDEGRLNEIEARLNELSRLRKKYGQTVADMIAYKEQISLELDEITNRESHIEQLRKEMDNTKKEAIEIAESLSRLRRKTAKQLERQVEKELADLYLEDAQFKVHFQSPEELHLNKDGLDQVTFMLSTNLGEPLKSLDKVASGGELSRIMLALKKIFAEHDLIQTVVFDEIDAGVSGRVAQAIAEKMYQISTTTQTLCITHLPQVAAMADHHLFIQKISKDEQTFTRISSLKDKSIVETLGKMMTGAKLTDSALEHAEELLELTEQFKSSIGK